MATIYRKTARGVEEIQTRAHRLGPRLRSALILVDGQRSDEELARMLPNAPETLAALLQQGFIELLAELAAGSAAPGAAGSAKGFGPTTQPATLGGNPAARERDFALVRREAVRRFFELMGPEGGEMLAMRMERCRDMQQLRPLLVNAHKMLSAVHGAQVGDDYIAYLSGL